MTLEQTISLLTSLMSIVVAVLLSAIPWAYGVHGRLTRIESSLSEHLLGRERLAELDKRLTRLELAAERGRAVV